MRGARRSLRKSNPTGMRELQATATRRFGPRSCLAARPRAIVAGSKRVDLRFERAVLANVCGVDERVELPNGQSMICIVVNATRALNPRVPEALAGFRGDDRVNDTSSALATFLQRVGKAKTLRAVRHAIDPL